jgi:hypothetical protein
MNSFLTKLWSTLSEEEKSTWFPLALKNNVLPYNSFFAFNMYRWTVNQGPMRSMIVPSLEAYVPTLFLSGSGSPGRAFLSVEPNVSASSIDVKGVGTTPTPNCEGHYVYLEDHDGYPGFRRDTAPFFRLFHSSGYHGFFLVTNDSYSITDSFWASDALESAYFIPGPECYGDLETTDILPGVSSDPAAAVAIFRDSEDVLAPNRRLCRAVLQLDASGCVQWTDCNQVGQKPAPPGGFPAGNYHYAAVPLSLDGRMGAISADAEIVVSPF